MTVGDFMDMPWHQGWNPVPDREWMASLARRWVSFPADALPRPLVLVAEPGHAAGFITEEAKVAWMAGTASTSTAAAEEPALFATDRGMQSLPSVREDVAGSVGPIIRADLSQVSVWSPHGRPHDEHWYSGVEATADSYDPLALTWRFLGSPESYTDYPDAAVLETATAVVVVPRPVERPDTDSRQSRGQTRQVTARLERPPAGRVLLDVYGRVAVLSTP